MLEPDLSEQARDFINARTPKVRTQIAKKLAMLCENPHAGDTIAVKGFPPNVRTRASTDEGEIRIVHQVENGDTLLVVIIERRDDDQVYKELKRLYG